MELKDSLIALREYLGISQEELGSRIGLSRFSISNYESGKRNITDRVMQDIFREFHVNEEWFRTGMGNPIIELDRDDEITVWAGSLAKPNDNNEFMKKFVHMLSRLKEEDWKVLEKMALLMAEENKEG